MTGPSASLVERVAALLSDAARAEGPTPAGAELRRIAADLDGPLHVAIAGWMKAGKSTLLNALVGADLAPTDAGECTRVLTRYRWGPHAEARAHLDDATTVALPLALDDGAARFELPTDLAATVAWVDVSYPAPALRRLSFLDTPGLESPTPRLSDRVRSAIRGELAGFGVDAVIYLVRHLHPADVSFLEAFAAAPRAEAGPVNAVGVLARADELGGGRSDAADVARRIAERYGADPRLRRLVQTVIAVDGLLALEAPRLGEADLAALGHLAELPARTRALVLCSAEALVRHPDPAVVPPVVRAGLIRRLGPFGLRLAVELLTGPEAVPAEALPDALERRSGIDELRELLARRFAARSDALKARAALAAAGRVTAAMDHERGRQLAAALEAVAANAHELVELGALNRLRTHPPALPPAELAEAERLLGGFGPSARTRLGLDAGRPDEVAAAAGEAASRWRSRAEQGWADPEVVRVARVVTRTCEALAAPAGAAHGALSAG